MSIPRDWLRLALEDIALSRAASRTGAPSEIASADTLFWDRGLGHGAPRLRSEQTLSPQSGVLGPVVRLIGALLEGARAIDRRHDEREGRAVLASLAAALDKDALVEVFCDAEIYDERGEKALIALGSALRSRRYLYGNPLVGLSLHHGLTSIDARLCWRLLPRVLKGETDPAAFAAEREEARAERRALVLDVARLSRWRAEIDGELHEKSSRWQLARFGFERGEKRTLIDVLGRAHEAHREPLDENAAHHHLTRLVLVNRVDGRPGPEGANFVDETARHYGISMEALEAARTRASDYIDDNRELFDPMGYAVAFEVDGAPVPMKLARYVRQNLGLIWTEIRETGDLAFLLAKRGAGQPWSDDEQERVKEQLKDVARVVPGLAVFSLPGGALLLPLLLKLLPFDLRPSAFRGTPFRALEAPPIPLLPAARPPDVDVPGVVADGSPAPGRDHEP